MFPCVSQHIPVFGSYGSPNSSEKQSFPSSVSVWFPLKTARFPCDSRKQFHLYEGSTVYLYYNTYYDTDPCLSCLSNEWMDQSINQLIESINRWRIFIINQSIIVISTKVLQCISTTIPIVVCHTLMYLSVSSHFSWGIWIYGRMTFVML